MDEFDSDGQLVRKDNNCARFKKTSGTPQFAVGMKFRSKKQFKKAIIRYGLGERKVINIIKDEAKRVRAKCDWHVCPWVCLLSNNSRTESWQIVTTCVEMIPLPKQTMRVLRSCGNSRYLRRI